MRKTPGWLKDYEMTEMSVCKEIRRPTSSIAEDVGVGGCWKMDIPGTVPSETPSHQNRFGQTGRE